MTAHLITVFADLPILIAMDKENGKDSEWKDWA